jgi:hypothetical protein
MGGKRVSGIPDVCPVCGTAAEDMELRNLVEVSWLTGWIFKTERVQYLAGEPLFRTLKEVEFNGDGIKPHIQEILLEVLADIQDRVKQ